MKRHENVSPSQDDGSLTDVGGGYELAPMRPDTPLPELSGEPEVANAGNGRLVEAVGTALRRRAGPQADGQGQ